MREKDQCQKGRKSQWGPKRRKGAPSPHVNVFVDLRMGDYELSGYDGCGALKKVKSCAILSQISWMIYLPVLVILLFVGGWG